MMMVDAASPSIMHTSVETQDPSPDNIAVHQRHTLVEGGGLKLGFTYENLKNDLQLDSSSSSARVHVSTITIT
jgi:hypothetical protein